MREDIAFLVIVTLVLIVLNVVAISGSPELRTPGMLITLTGISALHILLYWAVGITFLLQNPLWKVGYLIVQGVLAVSLTLLTKSSIMIFGLYPALIGLAVSMLRPWWYAAAGTLVYLGLAAASTVVLQGWDSLPAWAWTAIPVTGFVIVYVTLYMRQAEARAQAQSLLEELEEANLQLLDYAAQVEDLTLATERQRMARELHDTLAQGLAGLILQLEAGSSHLEAGRSERAQEIIHQAMGRARATLADARQAIRDLREDSTGGEDIAEIVRQEVERFSSATGIPCELTLALPGTISDSICEHTRRIIIEGLANIARHAEANQVWLKAVSTGDELDLEIRDDGQGFDPAHEERTGHYGLVGMRERARLAGGTMEITSQPGKGTTLKFSFPT